jgi:serine/threonine protein kinase
MSKLAKFALENQKDAAQNEAFIQATQGKYIPVSFAGKGASGQVWFALQKSLVGGSIDLAQASVLRDQLCAIKVFLPANSSDIIQPNGNGPKVKQEIVALQAIRRNEGRLTHRFPRFVEASLADESEPHKHSFFAMSAIRGFSLEHMLDFAHLGLKCPSPEALVYHIYIQLSEALEFLHKSKPAMSKTDIQPRNIMVDEARADTPGFPNIVYIDFESSEQNIGSCEMITERSIFYFLIWVLASKDHLCGDKAVKSPSRLQTDICRGHDADWKEFVDALDEHRIGKFYKDLTIEVDQDLQVGGRFFNMAVAKRAAVDKFNRKVVDAMVKHTRTHTDAKHTPFPTEEMVLNAVIEDLDREISATE